MAPAIKRRNVVLPEHLVEGGQLGGPTIPALQFALNTPDTQAALAHGQDRSHLLRSDPLLGRTMRSSTATLEPVQALYLIATPP